MVTHYEQYKAPEELVSESFEGLERQFVPIPFVAKSFLPYFPLLLLSALCVRRFYEFEFKAGKLQLT